MRTLVTSFVVPESTGEINLEEFFLKFPRERVKVDSKIREFVHSVASGNETNEPFICNVYRGQKGLKFSDLLGPMGQPLYLNQIWGILDYLGLIGEALLEIPPSEEEINIALGYVLIDGECKALILEHEKEDGKEEEIHLHLRHPEHAEDDPVLFLEIT